MKIENNPNVIFKALASTLAKRYEAVSKNISVEPHGEKVEISFAAKELLHALNASKGIPDLREEKVSRIKNEIEIGTYKIFPDKTADDMLNETIQNNLALEMSRTVKPPIKRGNGEGHNNGNGTHKPPKK